MFMHCPAPGHCRNRRGATVAGCYVRAATRGSGGHPRTRLWPGSARAAVSPRTVLTPYLDLFAVPGTRAFSLTGLVARVPMATVGLGSVLLVQGETGSYALAGAVAGTLSLSFAVGSPQWARAMDRVGQSRVLRGTALLYLVF